MIAPPPTIMAKPDRTIINIDAQKQLAKLLATEDIQVTIGNFKTAYFDVKNRVLGLPAWNTDSKEVSDLLVGHEVGHALFTPEDGITKFKERYPKLPFDIANIVEDIRIEKMIQFKYPGLIKSFNDGYAYFKENDLFEIKDKDVNKLGFLDRINLKGKLRNLIDIKFSDEENVLLNKVNSCKTYDDVLDVIQELADFIDEQEKKNPENESPQPQPQNDDSKNNDPTNSTADDNQELEDSNKSSDDNDNNEESGEGGENADGHIKEHFKSETQDSLDKHLEDLSEVAENETILNSLPEKNIEKFIYTIDQVRHARKKSKYYSQLMDNDDINQKWLDFKNSTKKNVMILCKEFERRKAASSYARATQSRTGTINVNRLHSYKYDDQIFKSITNLADAKNHGMQIYIDTSGSMATCISDVYKQTIQLIMFCKTVGIPFSVYSFTSKSGRSFYKNGVWTRDYSEKKQWYRDNFPLGMNLDIYSVEVSELMNSSLNKFDYELALKELYVQSGSLSTSNVNIEVDVQYGNNTYRSNLPLQHNCMDSPIEEMGGTPLIETLIMAHALIKKFRKKNNVQKMISVFLTDGEGQTPSSHNTKPFTDEDNDKSDNFSRFGETDGWGNHRYIKIGNSTVDISRHGEAYSKLVEIIKKETGSKMIGFFLTTNANNGKLHAERALNGKFKTYCEMADYIDKCKNKAKKLKSNCYSIDNGYSYDTYFIIDNLKNLKLHDEEEYEIPSNVNTEELNKASNRNKLVTSFKKFNTTKRQSRIFLNKFIDTVI